MKTALTLLDEIQIASPCLARWDDMVGDDRSRHCLACNKSVYDLSGLTTQQALDLIREKNGELCVRLFRRADGRVLTADCPVGLRAKLRKVGRTVGVAFWLLLGLIGGLFGAGSALWFGVFPWQQRATLGAICLPSLADDGNDVIFGDPQEEVVGDDVIFGDE